MCVVWIVATTQATTCWRRANTYKKMYRFVCVSARTNNPKIQIPKDLNFLYAYELRPIEARQRNGLLNNFKAQVCACVSKRLWQCKNPNAFFGKAAFLLSYALIHMVHKYLSAFTHTHTHAQIGSECASVRTHRSAVSLKIVARIFFNCTHFSALQTAFAINSVFFVVVLVSHFNCWMSSLESDERLQL